MHMYGMQFCHGIRCALFGMGIHIQSNLDYPDLDYPDFSIIRTFSLVPIL